MWGGGECKALWMQLSVHFRREKERKASNPVMSKMPHTVKLTIPVISSQSSEHFVMSVSNHISLGWVQRGLVGG